MIEVLFGESEGGAMKIAKNYKKPDYHRGTIGWIGEKPNRKPSKKEFDRMFDGKPVGGSSREVICLPFLLDIGDIQTPIDERRKKVMIDMYTANGRFYSQEQLTQELESVWERYLNEIERLKAYVNAGEQIRIWYSEAPYSLCGFYYICHMLERTECTLSSIKLPEYIVNEEKEICSSTTWGEMEAGKLYQFLSLERPISDKEKTYFSHKWEMLKEDNSPLRAVINGNLTGVPEDYYDFIIRKELPEEEFAMARFIGNILGKYPIGVGDWWYAKRIKWMIEQGEIEVIEKNEDTYSQILKKTT